MDKDIHYIDPSHQRERSEYDEETAAKYVSDLQPIKEGRRRKRRKRLFILALLTLLALVTAGYFMFVRTDNKHVAQSPQAGGEQAVPAPQPSSQIKEYTSDSMNLAFSYPGDWKIDDSTRGLIKVESPIIKLADLNRDQADAKVVVTFLSSGSEVPGFGDSGAIAVKDSEKLAYAAPSQNQRAETYLSFAGFAGRGLNGVFVTGDSGYKIDQLIPESDVKKGDPIITVMFYSCSNSGCTEEESDMYTIDPAEWSTDKNLQAAYELLVSLRVD